MFDWPAGNPDLADQHVLKRTELAISRAGCLVAVTHLPGRLGGGGQGGQAGDPFAGGVSAGGGCLAAELDA